MKTKINKSIALNLLDSVLKVWNEEAKNFENDYDKYFENKYLDFVIFLIDKFQITETELVTIGENYSDLPDFDYEFFPFGLEE